MTRKSSTSILIKGYAIGSADRQIVRVDVTLDDGATWTPARITYQDGKWSWTIWETLLESVQPSGEVYSRATDSTGTTQMRDGKWNLRGVAYNPWGRRKY